MQKRWYFKSLVICGHGEECGLKSSSPHAAGVAALQIGIQRYKYLLGDLDLADRRNKEEDYQGNKAQQKLRNSRQRHKEVE